MKQRLYEYCQHIKFNYAMAGIDVQTYPVKRIIYYIDEEQHEQRISRPFSGIY
jgi:hypothetical protein